MDLRQLKYFSRIVELGNITAAAEALHIAQPSLSQHVANLEAELEVPLLIRSAGGVRPTDAGKLLYRHAKMVLRQVDEARAAIRHGRDTPSGRVTLGMPTSTSRILALPVIDAVSKAFPEVVLEVIEGSSASLAEAVARQQIDMSVAMNVQPQRSRMKTTLLLTEDLLLVGPSLDKKTVTLQEMADLPLVLPSFPNSIRLLIESVFSEAELDFNLLVETSALSILMDLVCAGRGWTVLPSSVLAGPAAQSAGGIVGTRIASEGFSRRVSLCLAATAEKSVACVAVHRAVIDVARGLVQRGEWTGVRLAS